MNTHIAIIGAGLAGLASALHLARRRYPITVFEQRSRDEIRSKDFGESPQTGRSMSMDLSARGIHTLKTLGLYEKVCSEAVPMLHRIFHDRYGNLTTIPYGRNDNEYILTVSRYFLYRALLEECLTYPNIEIQFEHALQKIEFKTLTLELNDQSKKKILRFQPNIVLGADGVNSIVRKAFECETKKEFKTTILKQAYKELFIPQEEGHSLELKAMHVWSRDQFMLVAQPNLDHSFTCALLLPEKDHFVSFDQIKNEKDIQELFLAHFPDAFLLIPNLTTDFFHNSTGRLRLLQGSAWTANGQVLLLGDAAHGMVPFFGQGVNCSFEDCTVLDQCLDEAFDHWPTALRLFEERRVANSNAIVEMSFENYPELHQSEICEKVLLKKQIEVLLSKKYPQTYLTYHSLVCFHRVPYLYAQACKKLQEPLLDRLSQNIRHVDDLDWRQVEKEIETYCNELNGIR